MTKSIHLNPQQMAAVQSTSRYIRIIAGAGSGKTRVLTTRIVYLVQTMGVHPGKILAITFTNKAANEMKNRVHQQLGDDGRYVFISTIHSLCVRILREEASQCKLPRNFTVLDGDDQKTIIKEAFKELGIDRQKFSLHYILDYIGANKGARISIDRAFELAGKFEGEFLKAKIYEYYVNKCEKMYYLDFDDLLLKSVDLFKRFPDTRLKWQRRFNYIHVDEFQDVDEVQYTLVKQLSGNDNYVCVVGDPDQTIYTWRGADVNLILNFEKDFNPCETIVLEENYRSTPAILAGANSLIQNNKYRVKKDLFTSRQPQDLITHVSCISEEEESRWIAQQVRLLHRNGQDYRSMAILYRSNYISRSIEKGLRDFSIPYVIYGGIRFYDRQEVKDALSYLRMISHHDDLAFLRTINQPRRGVGNKSLETIRKFAFAHGISLFETVCNHQLLSGMVQNRINDYTKMILSWQQKKESLSLEQLLTMVLDESGLRNQFETNNETDRIENLKELMNDIHDFLHNYPESTLDEYLQMVSLYSDRGEVIQGDYIQLMTVHAAKGLEFDNVILAAMSEGVFPNDRSINENISQGLEEERRLAYVAMTRARNKLMITESQGYSFVTNRPKIRSRFIDEIAEETIEHIGLEAKKKENLMKQDDDMYSMKIYSLKSKTSNSYTFKKGDLVTHTIFGSGVIIGATEDNLEIAFDFPHGTKKIAVNHPTLSKKGAVS